MKTYYPRPLALLLFLSGLLLGFASARAASLPNAWQIADVSIAASSGGLIYSTNLTSAQQMAATNSGWRLTVMSRLVDSRGGAHYMVYGNGTRRFTVNWNTNGAGQLAVAIGGWGTTNLTAAGQGTSAYHQHELVYDAATRLGTYLFDGVPLLTTLGEVQAAQSGQALWGALSSLATGRMNYHRVQFAINNLGTVADYFAGFEGNPTSAPDPVTQGWAVALPAVTGAVTNAPVAPDGVMVPCRPIVFVDSQFAGTPRGNDPDGAGPATRFGWDAFVTYEDAQEAICEDGTIQVAGGDIKIVGLEPAGENSVRVVFDDLAGLGQGAGCLYALQSASNLTASTAWTYVQTLGLEDLGQGRHQFIAPNLNSAQAYYRVVVWTPGATDTDHDGLADSLEIALGTDPNKFDTDGDGFGDCIEVTLGSNARDRNSLPPVNAFAQAEFATTDAVVLETNSILRIPVRFDRPYRGELRYEVSLSSSAGTNDFTDLSGGRVVVNGTNAQILLQLKEDLDIEPIETIALTLLKNTNAYYLRGVNFSHGVIIVDNDVSWAGTLLSPGMVSRFSLQVLRNGNQTTGWLRPALAGTNSVGTIPTPPSGQPGWAFVNWTNTSTRLQAVTTNLPMPASKLFAGKPLQRVINLSAIPPGTTNNPYFFTNSIVRGLDVGPIVIGGRYTDTLTPVGGAAGNRGGLEGVFTLTRELPIAPALTIPYVNP